MGRGWLVTPGCVERPPRLLTAHGLVSGPLLLFPVLLPLLPPTGSGSMILGKRLGVPGPLGVPLPKQTSLRPALGVHGFQRA